MTSTEYQQLVELLGRKLAKSTAGSTSRISVSPSCARRCSGTSMRSITASSDSSRSTTRASKAWDRIEAGLPDERGRREILERALAELKQHRAALQSRIEEIEQRLGH